MVRGLTKIVVALSADEQETVESCNQDLKHEVDGLRELRQIMGKAQAEIASTLNIKQPSVSQIERQNDMYLSTLRSYVEAVGGELELTVRFPNHPALRIHHLGNASTATATAARAARRR